MYANEFLPVQQVFGTVKDDCILFVNNRYFLREKTKLVWAYDRIKLFLVHLVIQNVQAETE